MKKKLLFGLLFFFSFNSFSQKFSLSDFSIQLSALVQPKEHIWVNSGYTTVNPEYNKVTGVKGFFSPPFLANDFSFRLNFEANGHPIPDAGSYGKDDCGLLYAGGTWQPDRIIRHGTYHYITNVGLISLYVTTELIPLYGESGFLLKCKIKNRDNKELKIKINSDINAGKPAMNSLNNWGFGAPWGSVEAVKADSSSWKNDAVKIKYYHNADAMTIGAGEEKACYFATIINASGKVSVKDVNYTALEEATKKAWEKRLDTYLKNIPVLTSDIDGLKEYYNHSLISGMVTFWENPAYKVNPHLSTCGMDGGGMCSYLWDWGGYVQQIMPLMLGNGIKERAMTFKGVDLSKKYAYSLDGSGVGVKYSYSTYSFTSLVWQVFLTTGPDRELYEEAKRLVFNDEKQRKAGEVLIDYGVQHNLLEMRGAGWEHYVASPNAERAWNLDHLAHMAGILMQDQNEANAWRLLADTIKKEIRAKLWIDDAAWFKTIYPDGHEEVCFSIQGFDALNALGDVALVKKAVRHVPEFLGNNGITSVAYTDKTHYEELDTDWSGGGAYTGDGPQLASFLYDYQYPDIAWDVLKRFFWMGKHMAYYPQELYYDRPQAPAHKRANIISGIAGAQTIIFGLAGFRYQIDGSLQIFPQPPVNTQIRLTDFRFKGKSIDLELYNGNMKVTVDNKMFYDGKIKKIIIP